jgi:hypothetical protein
MKDQLNEKTRSQPIAVLHLMNALGFLFDTNTVQNGFGSAAGYQSVFHVCKVAGA